MTGTTTSPFVVGMVVSVDDISATQYLLDSIDVSPRMYIRLTSSEVVASRGTDLTTSAAPLSNGVLASIIVVFDGTGSEIYVGNSLVAGPAATGTNAPDGLRIGGQYDGSAYQTGDCKSLIIIPDTGGDLDEVVALLWGYHQTII
jgi:hypothetical protein